MLLLPVENIDRVFQPINWSTHGDIADLYLCMIARKKVSFPLLKNHSHDLGRFDGRVPVRELFRFLVRDLESDFSHVYFSGHCSILKGP